MKASDLSQKAIVEAAGSLSLDAAGFRDCLRQDIEDAEVQRDLTEAASVGITGTPTFVLGRTAKGRVEGVKIVGSQPYSTFKAAIDELLSASGSK